MRLTFGKTSKIAFWIPTAGNDLSGNGSSHCLTALSTSLSIMEDHNVVLNSQQLVSCVDSLL